MSKIYALLVGINEYHPDSGVNSLDGCVNDVNAMEAFLKKHYDPPYEGNLHIEKLINEEATRENIIKGFQKFINQPYPTDTILFYYAGHGSHTGTLEVFKDFDGKEQDETFICYDSRLPGKYDLADKEMAVLLSRVRKDVHKIVIADSCFSGSITRGGKSRYYTGTDQVRTLESYLLQGDNYYKDILKKEGKITIPRSKHLLLSSCSREESAQETNDKRGLFSSKLLEALEETQDISYTHLFEKVRDLVAKESGNDQHPTMDAWEGFNPNNRFLRANTKPNSRHLIKYSQGKWSIDFGAIYGLPTLEADSNKIVIGIYDTIGQAGKLLAKSTLQKVHLANSWIDDTALNDLDTEKQYWGEFQNYPKAIPIEMNGEAALIKKFKEYYHKENNSFAPLQISPDSSRYILQLEEKEELFTARISSKILNKIITETTGPFPLSKETIKNVGEKLDTIAKWETTAALANNNINNLSKDIEVVFFIEPNNSKTQVPYKESSIQLDYPSESGKKEPIWYNIKAKNNGQELIYISLLHLSEDYEIKAYCQNQILETNNKWIILDDAHGLIIEDKHKATVTDIFKVIVSNKQFDAHKFLQAKLEQRTITRGEVLTRATVEKKKYFDNLPLELQEKWGVHTISVTLKRRKTEPKA